MSGWLDVLWKPASIYSAARRGDRDPMGAFAFLVDGELQYYLSNTQHSDWPSIDEAADPPAPYALPAALLMQMLGRPSADNYQSVVEDSTRESTERALANALLAAQLADSGDGAGSVDLLNTAIGSGSFADIPLAYLTLHLALRQMELGRADEAVQNCAAVRMVLRAGRADRVVRSSIRAISYANEFVFRQLAYGELNLALVEKDKASVKADSRVDVLTKRGLEADLDRGFRLRFSNTSTVQFGGGDAVESSLWGALAHSEASADFSAINRARQTLGRYVLASAAGLEDRAPDSAFSLLLRGRDGDGLTWAARSYVERGPIAPVSRFAQSLASTVWEPLTIVPALKFLVPAADVLPAQDVEPLLNHLCREYEGLIRPTALTRAESDALEAIAALTRVSPASGQATVSEFVLELARGSQDALVQQTLRRVVFAIDWTQQPDRLVDGWLEFVAQALGQDGNARVLAESVAISLQDVRHDQVLRLLRQIETDSGSVSMSAVMTGSAEDLTDGEARVAAEALIAAIDQIRESAAAGNFGFGRTYDPAAVLTVLLLKRQDLNSWNHVVAFLGDDRVQRADKVGALRVILSEFPAVPQNVVEQLRLRFTEIASAHSVAPFPDQSIEFESLRLRLASALEAMSAVELTHEILALAASADVHMRAEAARAAATVQFSDDVAGLSIVLLLSRDADPDVRALACRALLIRRWGTREDEEAFVWRRAVELLSEPGREPILGVLSGMYGGVDSELIPPSSMRTRVALLAADHPSWAVRSLASMLIARWDEALGSN